MNKKDFQTAMLLYLQKRLNETDHKGQERTVQMAYQMGVLIGMLYDLADADSYNYNKIIYTLYPELKNKK
jgi:hypothetical protein